jgi:hypothetical protein
MDLDGLVVQSISARAGETSLGGNSCRCSKVHPYLGGEASWTMLSVTMSNGSSPRRRGSCILINEDFHSVGIIPA